MTKRFYQSSCVVGIVFFAACSAPLDKEGKPFTHGTYRLRTFPSGARVWIDSELKVESTPATLVLKAGTYMLKIQHPGAEATEFNINIEVGKHKDRTFNIPRPPPASITVFSDLLGAKVRINGYVRGRTPLYQATTRPGPIDITVIAPGEQAKSIRTDLNIAEKKFIEVFFGAASCLPEDEVLTPQAMSSPPAEGRVSLAFKPAGTIFDTSGKAIGTSPLLDHLMPVGVHKLRLRSANNKYERSVKIEVEADKNHIFRFRLGPSDRIEGK